MIGPVDQEDRARSLAWLSNDMHVSVTTRLQLEIFVDALLDEATRQNLISSATVPNIWTRHIIDCAQLLRHVPRETSTWLDLGSGAGLPGLVCAILARQISFTLVEQRPLRTAWLQRAKDKLNLKNVDVRTANVANAELGKFDVISARAFAPLPKLLQLSAAFSTKDTAWVLPKGRSARQELDDLTNWHHTFHVEQSVTDPDAGIIVGTLIGRKGERRR